MDEKPDKVEETQEPRAKPVRTVAVTIPKRMPKIESKAGALVIVERENKGDVERFIVAESAIKDGRVAADLLVEPYGDDFAARLRVTVTPESIQALWHKMGIWTMADLQANWTKATYAVFGRIKEDLVNLIRG